MIFLCWQSACAQTRATVADSAEEPLEYEELITYQYELVESKDADLCRHMGTLYNRLFHQPWNFREYFRALDPQLFAFYYGSKPSRRWTQAEILSWDIRYALYPTSPEFEAIQWTLDSSSPARRSATFDIDNDGTSELVVQTRFYGSGEERSALDMLVADGDRIIADGIVRPFVFNGVVYLSHYEPNIGHEGEPFSRHAPPEKMWVRKYRRPVQDHETGVTNSEAICEFDMKWVEDPIKYFKRGN